MSVTHLDFLAAFVMLNRIWITFNAIISQITCLAVWLAVLKDWIEGTEALKLVGSCWSWRALEETAVDRAQRRQRNHHLEHTE